ncbi:MAG TPA: glycosyltransferase family 1 protein [Ilumatobacteraceae bacterium]|nr:glycosyltransferase family 1 protein [Ilumatobacteraceae bacterium]
MDSLLPVAFDVGPLSGPRTGIGVAVSEIETALRAGGRIQVVPYQISFRARNVDGVATLPVPAALAHRWWTRFDRPRIDRWWNSARLIHGTNYVVPPSSLPRVVSVYDTWFLRHPDLANPAVQRAGQILRRSVASGAVIHTTSHSTASQLGELFPDAEVDVIPLGPPALAPPPATCHLAQRLPRPFIVSIGTVERRKNVPALVDAFGHIDPRLSLDLVIAGRTGDDQAGLDAAVARLSSTQRTRVVLLGQIDERTKSWLLHHAAALAYPSLDEGFGFPVLEAFAAGLPVVASNAGSIPEVAGQAALLSDPMDRDALAANLTTVLDDQIRATLVGGGRQRLTAFSWPRCADQLADLYHRLVDALEPGR